MFEFCLLNVIMNCNKDAYTFSAETNPNVHRPQVSFCGTKGIGGPLLLGVLSKEKVVGSYCLTRNMSHMHNQLNLRYSYCCSYFDLIFKNISNWVYAIWSPHCFAKKGFWLPYPRSCLFSTKRTRRPLDLGVYSTMTLPVAHAGALAS